MDRYDAPVRSSGFELAPTRSQKTPYMSSPSVAFGGAWRVVSKSTHDADTNAVSAPIAARFLGTKLRRRRFIRPSRCAARVDQSRARVGERSHGSVIDASR